MKKVLILAAVLVATPASAGIFHKNEAPTYYRVWNQKLYVCAAGEREYLEPCQSSQEDLDRVMAGERETQARRDAQIADSYWYSTNGRIDPRNPYKKQWDKNDREYIKELSKLHDLTRKTCWDTAFALSSLQNLLTWVTSCSN